MYHFSEGGSMCGIVGCVGKEKCVPILLDGLKSLEYRGYDSAGMAYFNGGQIAITKAFGHVSNLEKEVNPGVNSFLGIAHTRWATNGAPSLKNAHPHRVGKITLVHNGIIENADEIKSRANYSFQSDTDSEVAAFVINKLYEETHDMVQALTLCNKELEGSYAFAILNEDEPTKLYTLKKSSPLIIGVGEHENFVASDIPAIISYTRKYIILEDEELAVIDEDKVSVYRDGRAITKEVRTSNLDATATRIDGYRHYMMKEIHEQPETLRKTIEKLIHNGSFDASLPTLSQYDSVEIIGCGSAYHVGCVGKSLFQDYAHVFCNAFIASEYRYEENLHYGKPLIIFISQSGETADTLACLRKVKEEGLDTLAIVNTKESSIAREAGKVVYIEAGPEIAVATTKAYTAQLAVLSILALKATAEHNPEFSVSPVMESFFRLPMVLQKVLEDDSQIRDIADHIYQEHDIFFLGRKVDYAICLEASLKLKEISYLHSEAYPAGELKHGTISLIQDKTPVISIITDSSIASKTISNVKEVLARGAYSIIFTTFDLESDDSLYEYLVLVPKLDPFVQSIVVVVLLQLLAYYVADNNGCSIDKPKNLAKSVTVE